MFSSHSSQRKKRRIPDSASGSAATSSKSTTAASAFAAAKPNRTAEPCLPSSFLSTQRDSMVPLIGTSPPKILAASHMQYQGDFYAPRTFQFLHTRVDRLLFAQR